MKVNTLLEETEAWRPSSSVKTKFITYVTKKLNEMIETLKPAVHPSANGQDLTTSYSILWSSGSGHYTESAPKVSSWREHLNSRYGFEESNNMELRGAVVMSLSNGDKIHIEAVFNYKADISPPRRGRSGEPDERESYDEKVQQVQLSAQVYRGKSSMYLTLSNGFGDLGTSAKLKTAIKQLNKYQVISDKLGKLVLQDRKKALRTFQSMHADPSALVRKTAHDQINAITAKLKRLSVDNQIGKLKDDDFKKAGLELADELKKLF